MFMLYYDISNCDCCGKISTNHDDDLLEKNYVIKRSHLSGNKLHLDVVVITFVIVNNYIVYKNQPKYPIICYNIMEDLHGNS